jgi:tryptophanyl-tRNA synthetase
MQHLQKTRGEGKLLPNAPEPKTGSEAPKHQGRKRVVSGMRPTGKLHIGHYFGALENWVRLQDATVPGAPANPPTPDSPLATRHSPLPQPEYDCFYFIADWHALTSDYADTSAVAQNTIEIMTDYLAAGLDPAKSIIFQQSLVPEHAELHLLLSMVTPLSWLERVPTYKEALEQVKDKDLHNYGFLGYPCLQTADIVIYSQEGTALFVPVGEDQVSHVELSREIVRRFNNFYAWRIHKENFFKTDNENRVLPLYATLCSYRSDGAPRFAGGTVTPEIVNWIATAVPQVSSLIGSRNLVRAVEDQARLLRTTVIGELIDSVPTLVEPDHALTHTPRIPGTDGRKMSKSYGNAITLSETDDDIRKKTKVMVTDPARKRRTDPGNPDVCPVYDWHKLFSAGEPGRLDWVRQGCTTAGIGCIECKAAMAENLIKWITPVRERRVKWENDLKGVVDMIHEGSKKARVEAKKTMERVREAVFHWNDKRREIGDSSVGPG